MVTIIRTFGDNTLGDDAIILRPQELNPALWEAHNQSGHQAGSADTFDRLVQRFTRHAGFEVLFPHDYGTFCECPDCQHHDV